ncbi:MAG TPA: NUDIX domain-containing protein [Verrucomicrobiae bacterium]|nr:NUDIX domain-containing protein [Verrucomicrobiae bacterium]
MDFRLAAKAFIIKDGKLFMIRRRPNDPHKPGAWDIPGGRLELGENPFEGLKRETREEISSDVEILMPIAVNHFVRDDGQRITLTMFLCNLEGDNIKLSEEHQEYRWFDIIKEIDQIPEFFHGAIINFQKYLK